MSDISAGLQHDIDTLTPEEMRHALTFLAGYSRAGVLAALASVEAARVRRAARRVGTALEGDR